MKTKNEWIKFRVTAEEKRLITQKAKNANMNVSEFLVNLAKRKRIVVVKELPQLMSDIYGAAVNINQIAKVANTQKYVNKSTVDKLTNEANELKIKIEEIIKSICEFEPESEVASINRMYELLTHINIKLDKLGEKIDGSF